MLRNLGFYLCTRIFIGNRARFFASVRNTAASNQEELFHFIHPEIEEEEARRIHNAIKRLVAYQKVPEICAYLKKLNQQNKLLLPPNPSFVYEELVRLGMPTSEGYSDKYFTKCYKLN